MTKKRDEFEEGTRKKAGEAPIRGWGALQDIGVFGPSPVAIVRGFVTDLDRILRQTINAKGLIRDDDRVIGARVAIVDLFSQNAIFADERFVVPDVGGILDGAWDGPGITLNEGDIVVIKRAKAK